MLNSWLKYVNNQRIKSSITSDYISTKKQLSLLRSTTNWLQKQLINQNLLSLSPVFSTSKNIVFTLLNKSFTHNPQHLLLELINEI